MGWQWTLHSRSLATMSNILGPPVGYVDLLDADLMAKQAKQAAGPRTSSPLRPSSAGQCARRLAFEEAEFAGLAPQTSEKREPEVARLLEFGNSVEYHVINMFQKMEMATLKALIPDIETFKVTYKQQVVSITALPDGRVIEGSMDLCFVSNKFKGVLDVKSKKDKFSSWTRGNWDETSDKLNNMASVRKVNERFFWVDDLPAFLDELPDPFLADNFYQLNLYAMTDFIQERGFDHASILQYNKNSSEMREIRFRLSKEISDYVKAKFSLVHDAVHTHKDPMQVPREAYLGSLRCAFCQHAQKCWGDAANAKQEYFDTFPDKQWPKDTNRLQPEIGGRLEELFGDYAAAQAKGNEADAIEAEICSIMDEARVNKLRLPDKTVWDLKLLKSPKPHFELRRGK